MKIIRRAALAVALAAGLLAGATATAHADSTIAIDCSQQEVNFHMCTLSGTVTEAVTEFNWKLAPGVQVAYGVYEMESGHGTIEYTPDKVIVKFNEDYAATHTDLKFNGFVDVRIDAFNYPAPYTVTIEGQGSVELAGSGYCDPECQRRPWEGQYKTVWDNENGNVDGHIVIGKTESTALVGQQITIKELAGQGLQGCTFTRVTVQNETNRGIWDNVDFTGSGTDTAVFTIEKPEAHRAFFTCVPVDGATNVTNKATVNDRELSTEWIRKNAGADGSGVLKQVPTPPPSTDTPTPTPSDTPTPTPSDTPTPTPSDTPTPTPSDTPTPTPSDTPTPTPSDTPTPTITPDKTPSTTKTPSETDTPSPSKTPKKPGLPKTGV